MRSFDAAVLSPSCLFPLMYIEINDSIVGKSYGAQRNTFQIWESIGNPSHIKDKQRGTNQTRGKRKRDWFSRLHHSPQSDQTTKNWDELVAKCKRCTSQHGYEWQKAKKHHESTAAPFIEAWKGLLVAIKHHQPNWCQVSGVENPSTFTPFINFFSNGFCGAFAVLGHA